MRKQETVTQAQKYVTQHRDIPSRARTPTTWGCHGVTRDTSTRDTDSLSVTRDTPALRPSHHGLQPGNAVGWMHIAALNLLADHEAGIAVPALKLEAAKRLLGR